MSIEALIVVVVFIEASLHYFPFHVVLRLFGIKELPRVAAYSLGVAGLMGPFTAWLIEQGHGGIAVVLWMVIASGGATVGLLYLLDLIINLAWERRESTAREVVVTELLKGGVHEQGKHS